MRQRFSHQGELGFGYKSMAGQRVLRHPQLFTGQEGRQHELFEQLAHTAIRLQARRALLGGLTGLGTGLVTTIGTGIVLFAGAHAVLNHHLTTGGLLVFVNYVGLLASTSATSPGSLARRAPTWRPAVRCIGRPRT